MNTFSICLSRVSKTESVDKAFPVEELSAILGSLEERSMLHSRMTMDIMCAWEVSQVTLYRKDYRKDYHKGCLPNTTYKRR
jgi:hypothetical protein